LPENAESGLFRRLGDAAAPHDAKAAARLYLQYLVMLKDEVELDFPPASAEDMQRLDAILSDPEQVFAAWDYLIMPEQIVPALPAGDDRVDALKMKWARVMLDNRKDARLSTKNQLYGWRPWLVFHFGGGGDESRPLPGGVADAIRADGKAADESVAGTSLRQSAINTVANVYRLARMVDDARALLKAEIDKSKTPYYFMGSLASLEESEGNTAEALEWRRKAYESAKGPATRIRWWASYVQALTRLAPGEADRIREVALYVFDESQGMGEIWSGANFRNLKRATGSLEAWESEQHPDEKLLADFRIAMEAACGAQPSGTPEQANCTAL
jgi:hypothetical protein